MHRFTLALVMASAYLLAISPATTPPMFKFWALAILWLNCIPVYHFIIIGHLKEAIPVMAIWGGFISLAYSFPVFLMNPQDYEVCDVTANSLEFAFWSFSLFYLYYYALRSVFVPRFRFKPLNYPITNVRYRLFAWFFLLIMFVTTKLFKIDSFSFIGAIGTYVFLGTYVVLLQKKIKISSFEKTGAISVVLSEFAERLLSGQILSFALLFIFFLIVLFILQTSLVNIMAICCGFVVLYSIYAPIKYKYRDRIWFSNEEFTATDKAKLLFELMTQPENYKKENQPLTERYNPSLIWRFSYQASALALILQETPSKVEYWNGSTYQVFSKFIPRIVWPDKPLEDANLRYNIAYQLVPPEAEVSPFPLPTLAEMYMNFGRKGVVYGMLCLALIYFLLNSYFNKAANNEINKVYGFAMMMSYINIEGNFTMTFGAIPLILVTMHALLAGFHWFCGRILGV